MYCKNCGNELSDDAKFCRKCGASVDDEDKKAAPAAPSDETQKDDKRELPAKKEKTVPSGGSGRVKQGGGMKIAGIFFLLVFIFLAILIAAVIFIVKYHPGSDGAESDITASDISFEINTEDIPENTIPSDIRDKMDEQADEYIESMKKEDSDIEGWSVYDKYIYGLHTENGSDTDNDGLTDKEEIEKYGSDPLKQSTSDDLYTDGYKVENGMDLFSHADYDGSAQIFDDSETISLKAYIPSDLNATIIDKTDEFSDDDGILKSIEGAPDQFYYAYQINNYSGSSITVDLAPYADKLGVDADDLDVKLVSFDGSSYDTVRNDDVVTLTLQDDGRIQANSDINIKNIYISDVSNKMKGAGFAMMSNTIVGVEMPWTAPKYGKVCKNCPNILLFGMETATEEEKEALLCAGEIMYYFNKGEKVRLDMDDINFITSKKEDTFDQVIRVIRDAPRYDEEHNTITTLIGSDFNGEPLPDQEIPKGFFEADYIWLSEDYLNNEYLRNYMEETRGIKKSSKKKESIVPSIFGLKDEFSFRNFSVNFANKKTEGLCMGMAQITAEVFNYGSVQTPADYYDEVEYDIAGYDKLKTFFNPVINDYSYDKNSKRPEDISFMFMLYCYWRKSCDILKDKIDWKDIVLNSADSKYLSWDTVENAIKYLDEGKILLCVLNCDNKRGQSHCVNIVGYRRENTPFINGRTQKKELVKTVTFYVYDCNYPQEIQYLQCLKTDVPETEKAILAYRYETKYYDSDFGFGRDNYIYSHEDGDKEIVFGIFNDKEDCLNVRY